MWYTYALKRMVPCSFATKRLQQKLVAWSLYICDIHMHCNGWSLVRLQQRDSSKSLLLGHFTSEIYICIAKDGPLFVCNRKTLWSYGCLSHCNGIFAIESDVNHNKKADKLHCRGLSLVRLQQRDSFELFVMRSAGCLSHRDVTSDVESDVNRTKRKMTSFGLHLFTKYKGNV